jgi:biopolymer transport protein ExbD
MKKLKTYRFFAVIPTASMADIAFLLIIFFMLTTSFSPVKMSVDLAEASFREEVEKGAAIIAIDPSGKIEISDGIRTGNVINGLDELDIFLAEVVSIEPTKQFIIRADRSLRYDIFNAVYERLRDNNCRRIALLTEGKAVRAPEVP